MAAEVTSRISRRRTSTRCPGDRMVRHSGDAWIGSQRVPGHASTSSSTTLIAPAMGMAMRAPAIPPNSAPIARLTAIVLGHDLEETTENSAAPASLDFPGWMCKLASANGSRPHHEWAGQRFRRGTIRSASVLAVNAGSSMIEFADGAF